MKQCSICKIDKELSEYYKNKYSKDGHKSSCKDCWKIQTKQYKQSPTYKKWEKEYSKTLKVKDYQKKYNQDLKIKVLQHYSQSLTPYCFCCGTTILSFLTLDHIKGKGTQERKKVTNNYYKYVVDNNFPEYLQVLCMNCNFAKKDKEKCSEHEPFEISFIVNNEQGSRFNFHPIED